ncbi:MAG TPA: TetR/AcrR family transcriptional regulator [Acidimicrobiales bacterium]|nr:TetR/AcrR family transcriptional regulator [Acidimicrobiales bacterium]
MVAPGAALRVVGDEAGSVAGTHAAVSGPSEPNLSSPQRVRIIDATLDCLALHGTAKTTVDDIARRAGVSRATVYRVFPGGRDEMLSAVVDTEMARLFSALGVRLGGARDLTEALVGGIVEASARIRGHRALAYLVEHEPEMVLGHLAFDESDRLLATASRFVAPFLSRWMSPPEAGRVAEWATRIVLSYAIAPSPRMDLTEPASARRLVEEFVVPGIRALHLAGAGPAVDISPFEPGSSRPAPSGTTQPQRSHKGR